MKTKEQIVRKAKMFVREMERQKFLLDGEDNFHNRESLRNSIEALKCRINTLSWASGVSFKKYLKD